MAPIPYPLLTLFHIIFTNLRTYVLYYNAIIGHCEPHMEGQKTGHDLCIYVETGVFRCERVNKDRLETLTEDVF
jgi:hypothetical protein